MGFEEYAIGLYPKETSSLYSGNNLQSFRKIVQEARRQWPMLCPDEAEMARLLPPKRAEQEILVSETPDGLFQVSFRLGNLRRDDILIGLRFAYSNPRSVYEPFCRVAEWFMTQYELCCHIDPDLAPDQEALADKVCETSNLRSLLLPSMDYNRRLWQSEAQTEEEAILRPGDAVERFITPLLSV